MVRGSYRTLCFEGFGKSAVASLSALSSLLSWASSVLSSLSVSSLSLSSWTALFLWVSQSPSLSQCLRLSVSQSRSLWVSEALRLSVYQFRSLSGVSVPQETACSQHTKCVFRTERMYVPNRERVFRKENVYSQERMRAPRRECVLQGENVCSEHKRCGFCWRCKALAKLVWSSFKQLLRAFLLSPWNSSKARQII